MNRDEFLNQIKPGDYFRTEFEYDDDENNTTAKGFCEGIVEQVIMDWHDFDNDYPSQPVIKCSKLITVDGIEPNDGDFIIGCGVDYTYKFMNDTEIKIFESKFK